MSFGLTPGIITDGPGADSYRTAIPVRVSVNAGSQIFNGQAFKRNINAVVGRNDLYPQYSQGDQGALPTSAAAGFVAGVYNGAIVSNSNNVPTNVGIAIVRLGVVRVRCAALNGGTAVTVGSILGFSAALGASTFDVPTVQGSYVIGAALGCVIGYQIQTALAATLSGTGLQTVNVANTDGITTSTALTIDYGQSVLETVTPTAVTPQVKSNGTITVGGTFSAGTILNATVNGIPVSYTVVSGDTTVAGAAASFARAINASSIVQGTNAVVGPAVAPAAIIYLTAINGGTQQNGATLTASAVGGTTTAVVSGSTLTGGVFGTITAPFLNVHALGATILGQNTLNGATIIPVPAATGGINIDTVLCDLAIVGA